MGIASGIFWIVFGIGYIIYRSFREDPKATTQGAAVFAVVAIMLAAWVVIFYSLTDYNLVIGGVFLFVSCCVWIYGFASEVNRRAKYRDETRKKYQRALSIARSETVNEEELEKFKKSFWDNAYGLSTYQKEKLEYRFSKGKADFSDLILKDYIENYRVYQIMAEL